MEQTANKTWGGGISEINPDNIKEMSVLKGPNAAALYSSRAANGVILITTKNGQGTKGLGVDVNSNIAFERPWIKTEISEYFTGVVMATAPGITTGGVATSPIPRKLRNTAPFTTQDILWLDQKVQMKAGELQWTGVW